MKNTYVVTADEGGHIVTRIVFCEEGEITEWFARHLPGVIPSVIHDVEDMKSRADYDSYIVYYNGLPLEPKKIDVDKVNKSKWRGYNAE